MKHLVKYLKGYTKECVLGPLFKLFEATLELFVPLVVAAMIDNGIDAGNKSYLVKAALILAALGAVGLIFSVTAQFFAAKASVGFVTRLRHALFAHVGKLSYSDLDRMGTSSLITRMTADCNTVQSGANLALRLLLRSPFVVFGAMVMAFTVDVPSAWTFAVVIPILSVVVFGIMLLSIPLYKKVQARLDRVLFTTRENISGARVIRAFGREEEEIKKFREENGALVAAQKFVGAISNLLNPLTYVLINAATLFLIYQGALRVDAGDLTQGQVVALYNYMGQILVELIKLASLIISITKALASAGRISSVLTTAPSMANGTLAFDANLCDDILVFDNVSLRYHAAGEDSLTGISFSVKRGETVGIIGGTGSGKSSLVNLIPRFYDATGGRILLFGEDIRRYDTESLREHIGVVPQKAVLFKGTLRDNMKWGNQNATDDEIAQAIETAQATKVVADKGGLDAAIEAGGRNFSGGQRQRLTIARALVKKPDILILDDSASALDFATDAALRRALREDTGDATVFIVSQRASSLLYADKIIVLDDGEAVAIGTHEELLHSCELYRDIYETQFAKGGATA
ncbi:MAG: ABC transporter ATP-binding protein [Clostridia bacterium]|nr:ABC transporter ATP-binding protein [Clostridia bacterium]